MVFGNSVILTATARVQGDISSRSLAIESGAIFDGGSRKLTDVVEAAPQVDSTAFKP